MFFIVQGCGNSQHPDLRKTKQEHGVHNENTWFKESIPTRKQGVARNPENNYYTEGMELSLQSDNWVSENVPTAFQTPGTIHLPEKKSNFQFPIKKTENLSNFIGFSNRVQLENNPIPTRQFPTELNTCRSLTSNLGMKY